MTCSTPILRCTEEIDLGVVFDTKLSLRNHIKMNINKANKLLVVMKRSFCAMDNTSFTLLNKAIVRAHLEYAATIWNPCKKAYIDDFEKVQLRATKLLLSISHLCYPELLAALCLPTFAYRRIRGDMMETFKILNNIYDSRVTNFLSKINFSTTRGHSFKLFVQHVDFYIRKLFFSIRIVDICYRLSSNVVNAPNVVCFEERLDKCLADLKIKFDLEAPHNYSEFSYTKINTPQSIDFDSKLGVEANTISAQYKTCE